MVIKRIKRFLQKLALKETSPKALSISFCVGVFVAFSPFVGLHTIMIFIIAWIFSLNLPVAMSTSFFFNNPWTMVPVYSTNYFFGHWFLKNILGLNPLSMNPVWMEWLNGLLFEYTGIHGISFWSFMLGGNLLGIILSVMLYPVVRLIFERMTDGVRVQQGVTIKLETKEMRIDEGYREE